MYLKKKILISVQLIIYGYEEKIEPFVLEPQFMDMNYLPTYVNQHFIFIDQTKLKRQKNSLIKLITKL